MMDHAPPSSDYFQGLDGTAKLHYKEKLEKLGGIEDPYLQWGHSMSGKTGRRLNTPTSIM